MTHSLEALSDRLLSLMVPKTRASACYCYTQRCRSYPSPCWVRDCCHCSSGGTHCGWCYKAC